MGAESWSAAPYQWNATGIIDEVRISNTPRSANWLLTEYRNQNDPSTFYTVGSEESFICAGSGPYYVQSRSLSFGSVSQTTITLPYSTTSGNLLVLSLVYADQGLSVSSVTDSNGNTYTKAVGPTNIGGWGRLYTYYVNNAIGGATPITATVTLSGTANTVFDVFFLEYSGVAAISPLDRISAGSASSGTAMNSGANTTTMAPSLIYGFGADDYTCHATSPYTDRETADGQCAVDRTVFMTDTYNVTATQSSSGNWALQMATFKGA